MARFSRITRLMSIRMVHDLSWAMVGRVINVVVALVTLKVWAVYLDPAELGQMALIISTASILVGIVVDPLSRSILARYAHYTQRNVEREFCAVALDAINRYAIMSVYVVLFVGACAVYSYNLHWSTPLMVAGLLMVDARISYERTLLIAQRRHRVVEIVNVWSVVLRLIFMWFFLVYFGTSAHHAVAGTLMGAITSLLVHLNLAGFDGRSRTKSMGAEWYKEMRADLLQIAWPIAPLNILTNASEMGSRYIIAAFLGIYEAGLFTATYGIVRRAFGLLSDIGFTVLAPAYSEAVAKGDSSSSRSVRLVWLYGIALLSTLGVAIFNGLQDNVVSVLLAERYYGASDYLVGLSMGLAMFNVSTAANGVLLVHGGTKSILIGGLVSAVFINALMIALIPLYGLHGAVYAFGGGLALQLILLLAALRRV